MPLAAGRLDRRICIQRATITKDAINNDVETWVNILPGDGMVSASKSDKAAGEKLAAAERGADIVTVFEVRYSTDLARVNPRDRILLDERTYDILGSVEIGRREGLQITAIARAEGGLPQVFS